MDSVGHVSVPLRAGGKKMRKRRELDALMAHSLAKRQHNGNGITSHDQLLSNSTDEQEDYSWPKVRSQSRCRAKRLSCLRTCGPLILVSCIFLSLGFMYWLYFDIRQQISEYRTRIEQVSATSQNVPEALQKWHETSKFLEQNQTSLNTKLKNITQVLDNFSVELKQLKESIEKKNENSQESQLNELKTTVASLGSKIEDTILRVAKLEEQYSDIQMDQKERRKLVEDLQNRIQQIQNTSTPSASSVSISSLTSLNSNITDQFMKNITTLSVQFTKLSENVSTEINNLHENFNILKTDEENNHKDIASLKENQLNISSHLVSIENIWMQLRTNLSGIETNAQRLNDEIGLLENSTSLLKKSLGDVQNECQTYHNQNDQILKDINGIKTKLETTDSKEENQTKIQIVVPEAQPATQATLSVNQNASSVISTSQPQSTSSPTTTTVKPKVTDNTVTSNISPSEEKLHNMFSQLDHM